MEESVQRRERLKAMRMEASQDATTYMDGSQDPSVSLSNPLLESTANPEGQVQTFAQTFNYYTNPMAAFSENKQKSKVSPRTSQDYSSIPPIGSRTNERFTSPVQAPINRSPNLGMQQPQGQYVNANYAYTSNAPQGGNSPSPSSDFHGRGWNNNGPRPGGYRGPGQGGYPSPQPHFSSGPGRGSTQGGYPSPQPHFSSGPGRGSGQGGYPSPQPHFSGPGRGSTQSGYPSPQPHFSSSPGHGSGQGYASPGTHFRNSPNHGPGPGGYPNSGPNQGRGHWFGNSMSSGPSSGRGRGRWSGQGGGRGQGRGGAHNHVSAENRPDLFYNKSMVEDPWKFLEPVTWKSHKKQWLPHSLSTKKARVSESPRHQQQSSSQPSLAEILAASFNEATTDEPNAG